MTKHASSFLRDYKVIQPIYEGLKGGRDKAG